MQMNSAILKYAISKRIVLPRGSQLPIVSYVITRCILKWKIVSLAEVSRTFHFSVQKGRRDIVLPLNTNADLFRARVISKWQFFLFVRCTLRWKDYRFAISFLENLIWKVEKYSSVRMQQYALTKCIILIYSRVKAFCMFALTRRVLKWKIDADPIICGMWFYFLTIDYCVSIDAIRASLTEHSIFLSQSFFCFLKIMIWIIELATDDKWRNLIRKKKRN